MWRIALTALALLAVPACGGEESPGAEGEPNGAGGPGAPVEVVLTDFAVTPAGALGPGATTLRVVNDGAVVHALRLEGAGVEAETGDLAPGESEELEVDLAEGDVVLWCPVGNHRELGMEASLTVGEGEAPEEDTTTGDDEDGYRY